MFPASIASPSPWSILNTISGSHAATIGMLNGTRWLGAELVGEPFGRAGVPIVLANAATDPIYGGGAVLGRRPPPPGDGGGGMTLPHYAVPATIVGAMAASVLQRASVTERTQIEAARLRFGLSRTEAADILAAHAYVWGRDTAPRVFWIVPYSGVQNQRVAEALMWHERANPGTLGLAIRGHQAAQDVVRTVVAQVVAGAAPTDVLVLDRISIVHDNLSTNSDRARTVLGLASNQPQNQLWAAHHLIPFAVMAGLPAPVQLAIANARWVIDSAENLIALPANWQTFGNAPNLRRLPYHSSKHPMYSADVTASLSVIMPAMPVPALRAALLTIEQAFTARLVAGRYHDRVH